MWMPTWRLIALTCNAIQKYVFALHAPISIPRLYLFDEMTCPWVNEWNKCLLSLPTKSDGDKALVSLRPSWVSECSEMVWFSAPLPNIWPHGELKMDQIWGFRTLTWKGFIQLISNLSSVLIEWVFRNFFYFRSVAKFFVLCCQSDNEINKALIWKTDVCYWFSGSRWRLCHCWCLVYQLIDKV